MPLFGATPVDSNEDSVTVNATQLPVLTLDKTTTTATFAAVGAVITYSYNLKNTGNVTLAGPFTVTDDKASVTCPNDISLAVGASIDCAATYAVTQTDLNAGSVTNTAKGHALFGATPVDSNEDSVTVNATQLPVLTLDKTTTTATFAAVGAVITYSYNLKNTGNVTLAGPFTVTDDKASVTCPNDISLAVGASIDCAATYAVTQTDLNAGSVTNTAKGHALFGATPVDSNEDSVTVNATPTPPLTLDKTADPTSYNSAGQVSNYTPVATNTSTNTPTNTPTASPTLAGTPTETPHPDTDRHASTYVDAGGADADGHGDCGSHHTSAADTHGPGGTRSGKQAWSYRRNFQRRRRGADHQSRGVCEVAICRR